MKTTCLVLLLAVPTVVQGAGTETSAEPAFQTAGAFFAVSVADLQASARWYSDKLGLTVTMETPKRDKAAVTVLEGGGLIVELVQLDDALPLSKVAPNIAERQMVHGVFKAGIVVDNFERTIEMLRARGVEIAFGPFPARGNQRANAIIRDNAGTLIQFFGK